MSPEPIYKILNVPIDQIKKNPSNPRTISEAKFNQLVNSIKDAPWMLKLRPIVINNEGVILGGNQRFRACVEAGLTHVWAIRADLVNDEQQRRFIIRDNVDFGKWDQELLKRIYRDEELVRYGIEIDILAPPNFSFSNNDPSASPMCDDTVEPNIPSEDIGNASRHFNDSAIKQIAFFLPKEIYDETLKELDSISRKLDCDDNSEVLLRLINFYESANGLSEVE